MKYMIILGIDPGIGRVGYGVIEPKGSRFTVHAYGCIETPKNSDHATRLGAIRTQLDALLLKYKPKIVGIEKLFFQKNIKTATAVGEARGVILLSAHESGATVVEVGPGQVKQSLTGYGNADKKQMQEMVKIIFGLARVPKPDDAADALAIAYTTAVLTPSPL